MCEYVITKQYHFLRIEITNCYQINFMRQQHCKNCEISCPLIWISLHWREQNQEFIFCFPKIASSVTCRLELIKTRCLPSLVATFFWALVGVCSVLELTSDEMLELPLPSLPYCLPLFAPILSPSCPPSPWTLHSWGAPPARLATGKPARRDR